MREYYLRLDGVNLSNFVYDSKDLSTVRGGGLLLLDAPGLLETGLPEVGFKAISQGASWGLFSFESDADDAKKVRADVEAFFLGHPQLGHATIVVDVVAASSPEEFVSDRNSLLALNRWRQMTSPTLAIPEANKSAKTACDVDGVRPAVRDDWKGEARQVSESVYQRREYGKDQKQAFYEGRTGLTNLPLFSSEFEELSSYGDKDNLNQKMAVIYLDGNSFGSILKTRCRSKDDQSLFDTELREKQNGVLKALLEKTRSLPEWLNATENPPRFRFETLLWGGDEIIWVVPARLGWRTLAFFYNQSSNPQWCFKDEPLTHSAAIVFCHHNAPIHRITALAHDLCDHAKDRPEKGNFFTYQVLESFDDLGPNSKVVRRRLSPDGTLAPFTLAGKDIAEIATLIDTLKQEEFPRRKLHDMVHAVVEHKYNPEDEKDIRMSSEARKALDKLEPMLGGTQMKWLHIAELWDYARTEAE